MHFGYTAIKTILSTFILGFYLASIAWGGIVVFIDDTPDTATEVIWGGEANALADANIEGAYYMNGTSGNSETDRTGNSQTFTDGSSTVSSATVPPGYSGNSRDFELGDNDRLEKGDGGTIENTDDTFSVACWVRPESFQSTAGSWNLVVSKYQGTNNRSFMLNLQTTTSSTGYPSFRIYDTSDNSATASGTGGSMSAGTWYHIAGTYDGTTVRIYLDGTEVGTAAFTGNMDNSTAGFRISGVAAGFSYYDGLIDEVAFFSDVITPAEIQDLIDNGISGNKGGSD